MSRKASFIARLTSSQYATLGRASTFLSASCTAWKYGPCYSGTLPKAYVRIGGQPSFVSSCDWVSFDIRNSDSWSAPALFGAPTGVPSTSPPSTCDSLAGPFQPWYALMSLRPFLSTITLMPNGQLLPRYAVSFDRIVFMVSNLAVLYSGVISGSSCARNSNAWTEPSSLRTSGSPPACLMNSKTETESGSPAEPWMATFPMPSRSLRVWADLSRSSQLSGGLMPY